MKLAAIDSVEYAVLAHSRPPLETLDDGPGLDDSDVTELADPLRLVEVDNLPPKPENPWVAGLDSSGNRSPVRVNFESHMR